MIILDSSGSVSDVFDKQRDLAVKLVEQIPAGSFDTRVAVAAVRFQKTAYVEFKFGSVKDKDEVIKKLAAIQSEGGDTSTVAGANLAVQEMKGNLRSDAAAVVVMITDGNAQV